MLPGIARQTGFDTGVLKKRLAVPAILRGDLRQEQTLAAAVLDDESVASNFDLSDRCDFTGRCQHQDFDLEVRQLVQRDRREPRIRIRDDAGEVDDRLPERRVKREMAKAAAQIAATMNRHERRMANGEPAQALRYRRRSTLHARLQRTPREIEQLQPVGFTEQINHESRVKMLSTGDKAIRRSGFSRNFF